MRISDWSSDVCSSDLFVVQADGAFDETIRGILNLKKLGQRVEIRMVLHRHTIGRLDRFAEFVVDRKSVVLGKSVSVRVDLGCRRIITKKKSMLYVLVINEKVHERTANNKD